MKIFEEGCSTGDCDSLELTVGANKAWLETYEPWAGDTETGFGRGGSFTISRDQARTLAKALLDWANEAAA